MTKSNKISLITFSIFMAEAILVYNIGNNGNAEKKQFQLPPTNDLIKIGGVVALFSVINGLIIKNVINGK